MMLKKEPISRSRIYGIWNNINSRCNNPNSGAYSKYGRKGIYMCDEWKVPSNFIEWSMNNGYDDLKTIDRIENSKGYSPCNCRWVSIIEQARNKTNSIKIMIDGEEKHIKEWCDIFNFNYYTARYRYLNGYDGLDVFSNTNFAGGVCKIDKIYQCAKNGNVVKIWNSTKEISESGFSRSKIYECINGNRKTHKGFKWYIEREIERVAKGE